MKVYLCGHTGSLNRGCEALVRSTTKILNMCGIDDLKALTFNIQDDMELGLDKDVELLAYPAKNLFEKVITGVFRVFKNNKISADITYNKTFRKLDKKNAVTFNMGGDTYCYQPPYLSYALNDYAKKRKIPNVLYGCSVDERVYKDTVMAKDLNKYTYITVREALSEKILKDIIDDNTKIIKICDPAFHLPIKETELPQGFIKGNTLGLNISPMVFKNEDDPDDIMYKNVYKLIDYVLQNTDMSVCLIPHVYNFKTNLADAKILSDIYKKYEADERVSLVDGELSCTELKYIISSCRFFIGARTHSTIAAYSTEVPCIALSYSIKSRGIATDLFGTEKGYAMPYKDIKDENELKDAFVDVLYNNEEKIKSIYKDVLPGYKETVINGTKKMLKELKND